jgi:glucan phosphoethanolaminetransferase (alkaline phosphatase superfamily)
MVGKYSTEWLVSTQSNCVFVSWCLCVLVCFGFFVSLFGKYSTEWLVSTQLNCVLVSLCLGVVSWCCVFVFLWIVRVRIGW